MKHRLPFAAAVSLSLVVVAFTAPSAVASMFRDNAAHRGAYASPRPPTLRTLKWRFRSGGGVIASPTIDNGVVYVGSEDHWLYALRVADGSLVWKFQTQGAVNSTAAVVDGRVFFSSLDGHVYALSAKAGTLLWRFATAGERRYTSSGLVMPTTQLAPDAFDVFLSSPAVASGTVYVGSGDHNVYALDATTGMQRWKFRTGDVVHASPAVVDGAVYVGSWDRFLYKLDAKTGTLRWKFATTHEPGMPGMVGIPSSAAVVNGIVYFGSRDGHFYAVDAQSGRPRWSHDDHASWVVASPAVTHGVVYVTTSDELKFLALDAATGRTIFSVPYNTYSFSSPAISGHFAYFGTFDGLFHMVDTRSGAQSAVFATAASHRNASKYLNAKGRIRDDTYGDGTLEATIVGLSHIFSLGSILSSPAIGNGLVVFGSTDGAIYALE